MKIIKISILFSFFFVLIVNSLFASSYSITASPGTGGTISPSGTTTVTAGQPYIAPTPYDPGQPYIAPYTDPGQPYIAPTYDPGQPYIAPTYYPEIPYVAPTWYGTWNKFTYVIDFNSRSSIDYGYPAFLSSANDSMSSSSGPGDTFDQDEEIFSSNLYWIIATNYTNTNGSWDSGQAHVAAWTDPGQPYIAPYMTDPGQEYIPETYYPGQDYIPPTPYNPGQPYIAPANKTYTITPNAGYSITSVTTDGVNRGAIGTWTFSDVQTNHTISAVFTVATPTVSDFTATTPYIKNPSTSISFIYTKPTTNVGVVECRLLNYDKSLWLVNWTTTASPIVLPVAGAPSSTGAYGYYIHCRNSTYTSVEKYSGLITVYINDNPVPNAGVDQTITLPISTISLTGTVTDTYSTPSTFVWTKFSGPNTPTIATPTALTTNISGLIQGTYVFRLTATDSGGLTGSNNITVIVAVNKPNPPTITGPTSFYKGVFKTFTITGN